MISSRYLSTICGLVAFALVPTLIHSYSREAPGDGRRTAVIPESLAGYASTPSSRNATWGKRRFDSDDWMERVYKDGTHEVRLAVIRSYDPKSLYHHPELAVAYGTQFSPVQVRQLSARPEIPVHVLNPAPGERAVGMYVLHYGDRFVGDPILFQLRTAGELLFSRRKPMTLFFAVQVNPPETSQIETLTSASVLFSAIDAFLAQRPGELADTE